MNMTFKAAMMKEWTLKDDKIICGKMEIPLSSISRIEHSLPKGLGSNGVIQVFHNIGTLGFSTLAYPKKQSEEGAQAAAYIADHAGDAAKALEKVRKEGFRKRCKICGNIFCYTFEDLENNKRLAKSATLSAFGSLGGTYASSATNIQTANDQLARIIDYTKCPKCGSRDLVDATEEDIARMQQPQGTVVQQASAADELKKFKELFDSGVISQEEFDAKKKQLLGL